MAFPKNLYGFIALIGGGQGALDRSEIDGADLDDQDHAFGVVSGKVYQYWLDEDSGAAESPPDVIAPDVNAGDKRWILSSISKLTGDLDAAGHSINNLLGIGAVPISAIQWSALGALVEWTDWTPTLIRLSGYDSARYFRIGDICFFVFSADAKDITSAGSYVTITLPFTSADTNFQAMPLSIFNGTAWATSAALIMKNSTILRIYKTAARDSWAGAETGVTFEIQSFFEIA